MVQNIDEVVELRDIGSSGLNLESTTQRLHQKQKQKEPEKPKEDGRSWYSKAADFLGMGLQTAADVGMGIAFFAGAPYIPIAYTAVKALGGLFTAGARLSKTSQYLREGEYGAAAGNFMADALAYALPGGTAAKYLGGEFFQKKEEPKTDLERTVDEDLPESMVRARAKKGRSTLMTKARSPQRELNGRELQHPAPYALRYST